MKTQPSIVGFFLGSILAFSCSNKEPKITDSLACISGTVIGSKCGVFAVKIDNRHNIPSSTWPLPVTKDGQNTFRYIDHVIGVLDLPDHLQKDGTSVFLNLRKASQEVHVIPCYTDMPPPPAPVYVVLKADQRKCPDHPTL